MRNESWLRHRLAPSARFRALGERLGAAEQGPALRVVTLVLALALFGWVIARGWVADDAAITARSTDNLLHGLGWRWNADERVQAFTHPLWALLLIPLMAVGLPWNLALLGLGLGTSALLLIVMVRGARSPLAALCGLGALAGSRAFVDFSTSGLENPLAALLLVALVGRTPRAAATANDVRVISLGVSLLALTRQDLVLLGAPVLACVCLLAARAGTPLRRIVFALALGQLPTLGWELFSIVYFGFPLPNTAYAKLDTGIDALTYARLGLGYYVDALGRDPWTLLAVPAFAGHAVRYRASPLPPALLLGVFAYLAYIVSIGGDFMAGRFFVAPLVCSVAVAVSRHVESVATSDWRLLGGVLVGSTLCLLRPLQPLLAPRVTGVFDERAQNKSTAVGTLLRRGAAGPDNTWLRLGAQWRGEASSEEAAASGRVVVRHAHAVGMLGLAAGPGVHIVDHLALTDAFLARLPAAYEPKIQIGHFERMGQWSSPVPVTRDCPPEHEVCRFWRDYTQTLEDGRCRLADANACRYWEALQTVTRGDLFSPERWRNILRLNTGQIEHWIDRARYRDATRIYPGMKQ